MSGHKPEWLKPDHYIMHNGKPAVVKGYFFTSDPVHNSDELIVTFANGVSASFNHAAMKPLPAQKTDIIIDAAYKLPRTAGSYLVFDKDRIQTVADVWAERRKDSTSETVMVSFNETRHVCRADALRTVPAADKAIAAELEQAQRDKKEKEAERRRQHAEIEKIYVKLAQSSGMRRYKAGFSARNKNKPT